MPRREVLADGVEIWLGDCRDVLPLIGRVAAMVTDPPYGINVIRSGRVHGGTSSARWRRAVPVRYGAQTWDEEINQGAIDVAISIVESAIVFGGNYYDLPPSPCWLVWDKETNGGLADCELAWTNLPSAVRRIRYLWNGFARANNEPRGDHPTQKPLGVMQWAIKQLPDEAQSILDPFMGSGTTGVACINLDRQFIGIEREPKYFDIARRRITEALAQPRLPFEPPARAQQEALFS